MSPSSVTANASVEPASQLDVTKTHAVTKRLLASFTLADRALARQLVVQTQRLQRVLTERDASAETHYLLGAALFQLQDYEAAREQLELACEAAPEQQAWQSLRELCCHNVESGLGARRPPVEPFRAEQLTYPAALHLRAPEGVQLPAGPSASDRRVELAREVTGGVLGWVVSKALQLVGVLGHNKTWAAQERLSKRVLGKSGARPLSAARALIADMMLGNLRTRMNSETLQDPYVGDLSGHAPPGQRRPEWTRYLPTADGSWRTDEPNMGKAGTRFPHQGLLDASETAVNRANDDTLPSPRLVSRMLLAPDGPRKEAPFLNLLASAWIQFQVHGWFNHRQLPAEDGMLRVPLDEDDPIRLATGQTHLEFRKTQPDVLSERGPVYFQNEVTHWWDASQVYGSDQATEDRLRSGPDGKLLPDGKLYLTPEGRLPIDPELGVEDTGFNRNWWVALSLFHELFALEHNQVCEQILAEHPSWSSDHVFKAARLEVAAKMARIHTLEWTPAVLPNRVLATGLNTNWHGIVETKFRPFEERRANRKWIPKDSVISGIIGSHTNTYGKPRMFSENFSEVYRLHAAVPDALHVRTVDGPTGESIHIEHTRERAAHGILARLGLETLTVSFAHQHMPMLIENNYPRFMLGMSTDGMPMFDLGAADILRARERGVPSYNQFRALLGRTRCLDYDDITKDPRKIEKLRSVYGVGGIEKVDLQVGMLFEDGDQRPFQGFDHTRFAVFLQEASRRLEADPFFTDKWNDPRVYSESMRERIQQTTLASLLLRHMPGLANAGLLGVNNAFEPWGTTVETAPEEHPLSAGEEWYARHIGDTN